MTRGIRHLGIFTFALLLVTPGAFAESSDYLEEDPYADQNNAPPPQRSTTPPPRRQGEVQENAPARPARQSPRTKPGNRKYFNDESPRVDAGVFHVGFAFGGNFYMEPRIDTDSTSPSYLAPTGDFYKDFGFQVGVYFDHDYSELDENIPLMLRGMIGYKYTLSSVHIFSFDGMVRRMFRFSENASFGLGIGASLALWYRAATATNTLEEIILLPTALLGAGFEFNPFMVDFKVALNRIGGDNTILGAELYFGFRL